MPSLAGPLAEGVLPGVLRSLYTERRTGLLHASRGAERASVCFVGGNIVYGSTTIKECRLGETLVRHGILRQHDRERAGNLVAQTGQRLGQILLDLGLLDADGLQDALALQVREVLLSVFSWRDGAYEFEEQDAANFRGFDKPLPLSTGEVILDAVWSIVDPDVIRYALGDLDRVLTPASDPLLRFQSIALSPTDGFLLSRVDGASSAREILALVPADALDVERSLCGLLYTGMVEFVKTAATRPSASVPSSPARLAVLTAHLASPGQDHYQVLGVSREATSADLLAAYFRLAKAYHPDQHHRPGLQDLEDVLQDLFIRVGEAHRCLSNARARADYDRAAGPARSAPPSPPAPVAPAAAEAQPVADASGASVDEAIEKAEAALAAGRILDVFVALDGVLPQARGRVRRRGRLLKAQAHLRVADGSKAAEDELKAALEEDAAHPEAHYLLGTIYKNGGAPALAAAEFRKALGLKPRYAEAQAALLELAPPTGAPTETGRLFRRLTGR